MKTVRSVLRSTKRGHFVWIKNEPLKRFELFRRMRFGRLAYTGMYSDLPLESTIQPKIVNDPVKEKTYTWYQKIFRFIFLKVFRMKI